MSIPCFSEPLRSCTALLLKTASHTALSDDIDRTTFYKKKKRKESCKSGTYYTKSFAVSFADPSQCYVFNHEKKEQQRVYNEKRIQ